MTTLTVFPHRRRGATASPLVSLVPSAGERATPVRGECSRPKTRPRLMRCTISAGPNLHTTPRSRPACWTSGPGRTWTAAISPFPGVQMRTTRRVVPAMDRSLAYTETTSRATNGAAAIRHTVSRSVEPTAPRWIQAATRPALAGATATSYRPGTTLPALPRVPNIRAIPVSWSPAMANTNHPLDVAVEEFDTAHRTLVRAFVHTDNQIDEIERAALDVVEMAHRIVREYRLRQVAGDSFARNGGTRLTRERFQDAGFGVIDLDLERRKRGANVIELFPNDRSAG